MVDHGWSWFSMIFSFSVPAHTMPSSPSIRKISLLNLWTHRIQGLLPSILLPQDSSTSVIWTHFSFPSFLSYAQRWKTQQNKTESTVITFIIDFGGMQSWAITAKEYDVPSLKGFQLLELRMMEKFESKMPRIQWLQPSVIGNGTSLHQIQPEIAIPSQHVPLDLPVEQDRLPQKKTSKNKKKSCKKGYRLSMFHFCALGPQKPKEMANSTLAGYNNKMTMMTPDRHCLDAPNISNGGPHRPQW